MVAMDIITMNTELFARESVCYAGSDVVGVVRVDLTRPIDITGIELYVLGLVELDWTERTSGGHRSSHREVHRTAEEHVLKESLVLWGSGREVVNAEVELLPSGSHIFPFKFHLPDDLPCSFEGSNGRVRYSVQSTLLCPSRDYTSVSNKTQEYFTVLNESALRKVKALQPVSDERDIIMESSQHGAAMLCGVGRGKPGGRITCSLRMPCQTFVCGEYLPVEINIHNLSCFKIRSTKCYLEQTVKYQLRGDPCVRDGVITSETQQEICQSQGNVIQPGAIYAWHPRHMCIPSLPPSHLASATCINHLINVTYALKLRVEAHSKTLVISIPITLANSSSLDNCHANYSLVDAYKFKDKKRSLSRSLSSQSNQVRPRIELAQASFSPKYHVYSSAPCGDIMRDLEESPGNKRRSRGIMLDVDLNQGSVV